MEDKIKEIIEDINKQTNLSVGKIYELVKGAHVLFKKIHGK